MFKVLHFKVRTQIVPSFVVVRILQKKMQLKSEVKVSQSCGSRLKIL